MHPEGEEDFLKFEQALKDKITTYEVKYIHSLFCQGWMNSRRVTAHGLPGHVPFLLLKGRQLFIEELFALFLCNAETSTGKKCGVVLKDNSVSIASMGYV